MPSYSTLTTLAMAAAVTTAQTFVPPGLGFFNLNLAVPSRPGFEQFTQVVANSGHFYAGGTTHTESSCSAQCCPSGTQTSFFSGANSLDSGVSPASALYLNTETAHAGETQKVFVAADGSLAYTAPGGKIPSDALATAFAYAPEADRTSYGAVSVPGRHFVACKRDTGAYQLATVKEGEGVPEGCEDRTPASRPEWFGISAGQYDNGL